MQLNKYLRITLSNLKCTFEYRLNEITGGKCSNFNEQLIFFFYKIILHYNSNKIIINLNTI